MVNIKNQIYKELVNEFKVIGIVKSDEREETIMNEMIKN